MGASSARAVVDAQSRSRYELVHTQSPMPAKMLEKHQQLLRSIPLFAELTPEQLAKVTALTEVRAYPARKVVVTQGEPARALFGIVHGRLKVASCGPDGK